MKDFIKNKYNILIPAILLLVLFIALILYVREYKTNRYANIKEVNVYQYFSSVKMEYVAKISRNKKNVILNFESNDFTVDLDSTPIYLENGMNVIFPKEMSVIFPLKDSQYKVNSLAEIYNSNNLYYLNIRNYNESLEHIFFYDGNNLYFFIDSVNLTIGDRTINLSPLSYVSSSYMNFVEYYDSENDIFETIDVTNEKVIVFNDFMSIDVASDKMLFDSGFTLLTKDFSTLKKIADM